MRNILKAETSIRESSLVPLLAADPPPSIAGARARSLCPGSNLAHNNTTTTTTNPAIPQRGLWAALGQEGSDLSNAPSPPLAIP